MFYQIIILIFISLFNFPLILSEELPFLALLTLDRCPNRCSGRGICLPDRRIKIPSPSKTTYTNPYKCRCRYPWTGPDCSTRADRLIIWYLSRGRSPFPPCCNICQSQFRPPESFAELTKLFRTLDCNPVLGDVPGIDPALKNKPPCSPLDIAKIEPSISSFLQLDEYIFEDLPEQKKQKEFVQWLNERTRFSHGLFGSFSAKANFKANLKVKTSFKANLKAKLNLKAAAKIGLKAVAKVGAKIGAGLKVGFKANVNINPMKFLKPRPRIRLPPSIPSELSWYLRLSPCCVMCDMDVRNRICDTERPLDPDVLLQENLKFFSASAKLSFKLGASTRRRRAAACPPPPPPIRIRLPSPYTGPPFEEPDCCYICLKRSQTTYRPNEVDPNAFDSSSSDSSASSDSDPSFLQTSETLQFTKCCNVCPSQYFINTMGKHGLLFDGRPLSFDVREMYRTHMQAEENAKTNPSGSDNNDNEPIEPILPSDSGSENENIDVPSPTIPPPEITPPTIPSLEPPISVQESSSDDNDGTSYPSPPSTAPPPLPSDAPPPPPLSGEGVKINDQI